MRKMPGIRINCCYCDRRVYKKNSKVQPDGFEETYQVITNSGRICNGCYHRWRRGEMTQTDLGQRTQTDSETDDERDTSETEEEEAEVENQNDKLNQAIASLFGRGRMSRGARGRGRGGRGFSVRLPPPMNSHDVNTTTPPIRGRPRGV